MSFPECARLGWSLRATSTVAPHVAKADAVSRRFLLLLRQLTTSDRNQVIIMLVCQADRALTAGRRGQMLRLSLARYLSGEVSCLLRRWKCLRSRLRYLLRQATVEWASWSLRQHSRLLTKQAQIIAAERHAPGPLPRPTAHKAVPFWASAVNMVVNPWKLIAGGRPLLRLP